MIRSLLLYLTVTAPALWSSEVCGQSDVSAPLPTQVVLVTNAHPFSLTKHPTLPLLYLTCNQAPESTNLVTIRLNADGSLIDGSRKAWPNVLSIDTTNQNFRHAIPRPVVLAEEKVLYLAACPLDPPRYCAETNNNEVAVMGLDGQGQPTRLLKAFRTTNAGHGIRTLGWDPVARRLFFTYDGNGWFGWCQMDKAGLPVSNQTRFLAFPNAFWHYVYRPEWERFYGYRGNTALGIMKLTRDGLREEFIQYAESGTGSMGNIDLSRKFLKLYMLDGPANRQLRVYRLAHDGRLTGVPRMFPLTDQTKLIRFDFKAGLLYAFSDDGALTTHSLDREGYPTLTAAMFPGRFDGIQDATVDETSGKVYVACKNASLPVK